MRACYVGGDYFLCRLALLLPGLIGGRLNGVLIFTDAVLIGISSFGFCLVVLGI
jgi:hypothetical protein